MMTRERELLQQALDALDRAISDDRAYIRECKDAAEAIRAHLAAQPAPGEPVALESVHLTRDIKGMCTVRVNGRVAIQDNGDIIDHMATLEWFAQPAPVVKEPLSPAHMLYIGRKYFGFPTPKAWFDAAHELEAAHGIAASSQPAPAPLTDTETHAELWKLAVRKGLITVRSELIDPRNHGTRVSWMQGHDKACDISNDAAAHGIAASPAAPAAPAQPAVRHVRKVGGSFQHTGAVVAEFKTTAGEPRIVLEFDAPVAGMLHVYRPDQVEPCEPAAPAATSASPAVPLTDDLIDSVIRDVAELDYSSPEGMPDVMLVTADELRGILQAHGIGGGNG